MYILFEEHQYESRLVEKVLKDIYVLIDYAFLDTTFGELENYLQISKSFVSLHP